MDGVCVAYVGGSEYYREWTGPLVRVKKTLNVFYSIVFDCPLPGP